LDEQTGAKASFLETPVQSRRADNTKVEIAEVQNNQNWFSWSFTTSI